MLNATPTGAQVIVLAGSRAQPVTLEQATPAIEQFLLNERKREILAKDIKAMRDARDDRVRRQVRGVGGGRWAPRPPRRVPCPPPKLPNPSESSAIPGLIAAARGPGRTRFPAPSLVRRPADVGAWRLTRMLPGWAHG